MTINPESSAGRPPIDGASLLDRCMNDPSFACMILKKIESQFATLLSSIDAAVSACDTAGLSRAAHGLKGASANMSAERVCDLARRLESFATPEGIMHAAPLVAALRQEVRQCVAYVPALTERFTRAVAA